MKTLPTHILPTSIHGIIIPPDTLAWISITFSAISLHLHISTSIQFNSTHICWAPTVCQVSPNAKEMILCTLFLVKEANSK